MATPRKLQEYIEKTNLAQEMQTIAVGTYELFGDTLASMGEEDGALMMRFQEKFFMRLKGFLLEKSEKVLGSQFSDEELQQLIEIYQLPVTQKMRETLPHLQQEVMNLLTDGQIDFERLSEEIMAELKS